MILLTNYILCKEDPLFFSNIYVYCQYNVIKKQLILFIINLCDLYIHLFVKFTNVFLFLVFFSILIIFFLNIFVFGHPFL